MRTTYQACIKLRYLINKVFDLALNPMRILMSGKAYTYKQ